MEVWKLIVAFGLGYAAHYCTPANIRAAYATARAAYARVAAVYAKVKALV